MACSGDVKIPIQFDELREDCESGFHISDIMDEETACSGDFAGVIDDFAMAVESEVELEQRHVDAMFNAVACFRCLSAEQKTDFTGSLISMCTQKMDNLSEQSTTKSKNDFKMSHYFLHILAAKAELHAPKEDADADKKAGKGKKKAHVSDSFHWSEWRHAVLKLFERAIAIDPSLIWFMGICEEAFLAGIWKYALQLLEDRPVGIAGTGGAETSLRALCVDIVLGCARQLATTSSSGDEMTTLCTASLDAVCRAEHMGPVFADIVRRENGRFSAQLMTEIGTMNLTDLNKSGTGVKNVGAFLVSMSDCAPRLMAQFLPSFIHLLDSEVYQIRSSIVHVMGSVVSYTHEICAKAASQPSTVNDNTERDEQNQEQLKRVRDSMMDMLIERTYDGSSYTRSAVLKTWSTVAEAGAIPLSRFELVAEVAVDRLQDKTAMVRRAAAALLISLLENNPFGGVLAGNQFAAQEKELSEHLVKCIDKLEDELKGSAAQSDPARRKSIQVKREPLGLESDEDDDELPAVSDDEEQVEISENTEVITLRNGIKYCSAAVRFIAAVDLGVPSVKQLLASKTSSDVVEVLRLVARASKFGMTPYSALLQSSFALVWHQDESIMKECLAAFLSVYLTDGAIGFEPQLLSDDLIARNLVDVCIQCGTSELASMEKIIGLLFAEKYLDSKAVGSLWTMVSSLSAVALISRSDATSSTEAATAEKNLAGALRVVAMVAKFCPTILSPSKLNTVLSVLLSPVVKQKMLFPIVLAGAQCIQSLSADLSPTSLAASPDQDGTIAATRALLLDSTEGICSLLVGDFVLEDSEYSKQWFGAAEELLHAIFYAHPSPDLVLARLLAVLYDRVFTASPVITGTGSSFQCSSGRLSRLLFALGQGAICSLVYAEKIAGLAKKAREKKILAEKEAAYSQLMQASEEMHDGGATEADSMEQEMGMAAATDAEHEQNFNRVIEVDLVCNEQNVLGKFHQMIAFIVANEKGQFNDPVVRENALLALCRYMTVSSHMCELYLPLLFTAVEQESNGRNKTTIMIALGDLAFRFPNSLEPWIGYMYARLSDESLLVRYNTLMVLTHLILNDMIKVKGQVSHVVMCLNDESDLVRGLASLFFSELSKRSNNPVYNLLGDVISFLSRDEGAVASLAAEGPVAAHRKLSQAEFQTTMTFLLSFVKKDKQADSLLERLVVRMGITAGQQQRRHLAFCISLLPITEKGVKKMIELIRHIKDSLTDDVISDCFKTCISRVKKSFVKGVAGEVNAILEEFEAAVGAIRGESDLLGESPPAVDGECGEENASAPPKVEPAKTAAKTTKSTSKAKKTKTARKKTVVSSDEDSNSEISVDEETEISFTDEKASSIKKARPPLKEVANRRVR